MIQRKLIGPFTELLTMNNLPIKGPIPDSKLEVIKQAGLLIEGDCIAKIGNFNELSEIADEKNYKIEELHTPYIAIPGLIDPHTHICWAGSRSNDYALRLEGKSYLEIAQKGGGIWNTVEQTRSTYVNILTKNLVDRVVRQLKDGITTIEVKSGYGLTPEDELKMLQAIKNADRRCIPDLISTCLAAHICPKDFSGSPREYLEMIVKELLPVVYEKGLANRVDIYIDNGAFKAEDAKYYLNEAQSMGFEITVHADQFSTGGSQLAIESDAVSADHLEASGDEEIKMIAQSNTIPVALPGSSIGLGLPFAPGRKILDSGGSLAIGSDWNPGSAPMGDLLIQASIFGMYEKLTIAETLAAVTSRAALALDLKDRGIIKEGNTADIIAFDFDDYREIIYNQGKIKPQRIWKNGLSIK
jgi:imidazolonepropionase